MTSAIGLHWVWRAGVRTSYVARQAVAGTRNSVVSRYQHLICETSNPVLADRVAGYRGVRVDANSQIWGGLALSSNTATFIDGSVTHMNWWYSIGSNQAYGVGLPAADEVGVNAGATTQVQLWVRAAPKCGNGVKEDLEMCDDGNVVNSDGCSATCAVERTAYKTCREILAANNQSVGNGAYVIDADGVGGQDPFPVYCDMTNDSGGWTLVGKVGQGEFMNLTNAQYLDLVANPTSDVNTGALTEGSIPAASSMAFFNRAHTNALFDASGKVVRADMSYNIQTSAANGTYFQKKTTVPNGWSFWAGLRNSLLWNNDGSGNGTDVNGFGTQFVLNKGSASYTSATDAVAHGGNGTFGYWSTYTHTLNDASTLLVSRRGGLMCDGFGNSQWLWLMTLDPNDWRFKNDTTSFAKTRIWIR
jgi:cysteine-rich repeat protein